MGSSANNRRGAFTSALAVATNLAVVLLLYSRLGFRALALAFKRVRNITDGQPDAGVDPASEGAGGRDDGELPGGVDVEVGQSLQYGALRRVRCGQDLVYRHAPCVFIKQDKVGERAAGVNAEICHGGILQHI